MSHLSQANKREQKEGADAPERAIVEEERRLAAAGHYQVEHLRPVLDSIGQVALQQELHSRVDEVERTVCRQE